MPPAGRSLRATVLPNAAYRVTMARIYAFANQKGGVGKTTTAVSLGVFIGSAGRRVLVIDADPQANATSSLGVNWNGLDRHIYEVLIGRMPISQAIMTLDQSAVALVPSCPQLAGAEVELVSVPRREHILGRALASIRADFDYIFIDTPPSLGLLTVNALAAADHGVIIPIQCEYLALEGLSHLLQTIQLVRDKLNPRLHVAGLVMTMFDTRTNLAKEVVEEVHQHFPKQAFRTVIPRNVRLGEAPSFGVPIFAYAPRSAGAEAYTALAREFLEREEGVSSTVTR
jgi:chromosome partitioning protein